jgi:2-polyprenyl-3-methyl-5-hydroxy-6-metoxy-1,4-benzoquinol methylase
VLASRADRYGLEPSAPARWAAARFQERGARDVLELGAGQGRDSVHFARLGMHVRALDFAESGAQAIRAKADDAHRRFAQGGRARLLRTAALRGGEL